MTYSSLGCSYRRPTVPGQRCGGYSSGYPCCSGEHTRKYEPMVERPHREPYGMCGGGEGGMALMHGMMPDYVLGRGVIRDVICCMLGCC